jgi:hypothetical protein
MHILSNLLDRKPYVAIIPPATGVGTTYIPNSISDIIISNTIVLNILESIVPYVKVLLMLATLIATILTIFMQIKKLKSKNIKDTYE